MTKLSLATALILGTALFAQAAEDLSSAFKEGTLEGRIRVNSVFTNWDDNSAANWGANKANGDSKGMAVGGSLIYQTAPLYGVSAGAGFYTTQPLGIFTDDLSDLGSTTKAGAKPTTGADLFARGPGSATNWGTGYSVLAQSYLQYQLAKSKIKGGRFLMNNPWITPNDTKMIPIAVEGINFVSKDIANTTIQLDYAEAIKERGMTYFGNMADTLDTPVAIKNYYRTHYTGTTAGFGKGNGAPGVAMVGITNKSIDALELQAWFMTWQDIVNQGRIEANYALPAGDVILSFGARYIQQWDTGAGDIILPKTGSAYDTASVKFKGDSDNKVDTKLLALRAAASYGTAKLMFAYAHTAAGGDIISPWRAFPTDGYTRSKTQTDWNANTSSYKLQLNYDLNQLIAGLSTVLSYSFYDRDVLKIGYVSQTDRYYGNGDTNQYNADVIYKVPAVKNLELKARYMIQQNQVVSNPYAANNLSQGFGSDTSNKELRLEANYRF